jgi:carbamoyl-phosphate synthase small subunit
MLEDGSVYDGYAFAGIGEAFGEVVFNTGMAGYQEVLTDPSYKGQILVMTYPLIGNYGINAEDMESDAIHMEGFVVREYQGVPSNFRSTKTLKNFLEEFGKPGLDDVDIRAITKKLRIRGAMKGVLSTDTDDPVRLLERLRAYPGLVGQDMVRHVTGKAAYLWDEGSKKPVSEAGSRGRRKRIVVLDCGVKYNILRHLEGHGCQVIVVPSTTSASDILNWEPEGILLSNGPGDPEPLDYIIETVRSLLGRLPVFGICLGHQLMGIAAGGKTSKLKFGHHGVNQPVKNLGTGKIEITSQNHGFVVIAETLPDDAVVTHINLNDNSLEGLVYPKKKAFSVQYHPEAAPGPFDSSYLFRDFMALMEEK